MKIIPLTPITSQYEHENSTCHIVLNVLQLSENDLIRRGSPERLFLTNWTNYMS